MFDQLCLQYNAKRRHIFKDNLSFCMYKSAEWLICYVLIVKTLIGQLQSYKVM